MTRWRDPTPGDIIIVMDRWQIESEPWPMYQWLCEFPNTYHSDREQVSWILSEPDLMWGILRWPELTRYLVSRH